MRLSLWRKFFTLTKTKVSTQHSRTDCCLCWRLTHRFCAVNTPEIATHNFQLLQNAYATVSETSRRKAYDAELAASDVARKKPGPRVRTTKSGIGSQNARQQRARGESGNSDKSVAPDHVRRRVARSNRAQVAKGTDTPPTLPNMPWVVQFVFTLAVVRPCMQVGARDPTARLCVTGRSRNRKTEAEAEDGGQSGVSDDNRA